MFLRVRALGVFVDTLTVPEECKLEVAHVSEELREFLCAEEETGGVAISREGTVPGTSREGTGVPPVNQGLILLYCL